VIPRLTDLYARLEAAKGKKRRPAAASSIPDSATSG